LAIPFTVLPSFSASSCLVGLRGIGSPFMLPIGKYLSSYSSGRMGLITHANETGHPLLRQEHVTPYPSTQSRDKLAGALPERIIGVSGFSMECKIVRFCHRFLFWHHLLPVNAHIQFCLSFFYRMQ
jgi:hypothetical protein